MAVNLGVSLAIQVAGTAEADLKKIGASVGDVAGEAGKANAAFSSAAKSIGLFAAGFLSIGTAIAGVRAVVRITTEIEDGMIGVAKTTGIAGDELANLKGDLLAISRTTPTTTQGLLEIAQSAGQLGIEGSANIVKFTETIAQLALASDLAGEDGATILARLFNVTGEDIQNIDRIAAAIVGLGNKSAATESQIARFAGELARNTQGFGIQAVEFVGLGTAFAELGLRVEETSSVFGRTMRTLGKAINEGGTELELLAALFGTTGEAIREAFKADALATTLDFLEKLAPLGDRAGVALEMLGLSGDEINSVLPTVATHIDGVNKRLEEGGVLYEENAAHSDEAKKAAEGLTAQWTRLGTEAAVAIDAMFGEGSAPYEALRWAISGVADELVRMNDAALLAHAALKPVVEMIPKEAATSENLKGFFSGFMTIPGDALSGVAKAAAEVAAEAPPATNALEEMRRVMEAKEAADKAGKDAAREHSKALSEQERAAERAAREIERAAESVIQLNERYRREVESRTEAGLLGLRDEDIAREVAALRAAGAAEAEILTAQQRLLDEYASKMEAFADRRAHALDYMKPKVDLGEIERGLASELPSVDFDAVEDGLFQPPPQSFSDGVRQGIDDLKEFNSQVNLGRRAASLMAETLGGGFTDALMAIANGSAKAGDAFKDFGKRVIETLIQIAIQQAAIAAIGWLLAPFTAGGSVVASGALSAGMAGTSAGAMGFGSPGGGAPSVSLAGIQSAAGTAPTREPSHTTVNINATDARSFKDLLAREGGDVIKGVMSRASLQPSYGRG